MSACKWCGDQGLVFLKYLEERGYDVAVCVCEAGKWYLVPWQLRAWVDQQGDQGPEYFGRLGDFLTEQELAMFSTVEGDTLEEFSRTSAQVTAVPSVAGSQTESRKGSRRPG